MKGIAKLQDGWYRLTCSCGDEDHRADIEIENDKEFNNVTIYFHKYVSYVRRKFWERVKDAWRILWKKEITFESDFIIQDKEQIDGLIDILQEGRETIDGVNAIFKVQKTRTNAILPTKAYDTDAGFDVYASEDISLQPGETKLVNFGFRIGLKPGWEAQMRNKSGVVTKRNVFMKLGVGTIDSDYRGDIMAPFINMGRDYITFRRGEKVAQMVFKRVPYVKLEEKEVDTKTIRGTGGFGSTGR